MNSYSVMHWQGKYIVVKTLPNGRKFHLQSVYRNACIWCFDPLYARKFAYSTAMKHLKNLRASDPDCEEDVK